MRWRVEKVDMSGRNDGTGGDRRSGYGWLEGWSDVYGSGVMVQWCGDGYGSEGMVMET